MTPEGVEHTFNQFGSGTLAGADTYLSQHMLVNPQALATEALALHHLGVKHPFLRMSVQEIAPLVTTPYTVKRQPPTEHVPAPMRRHGSCGMGIGETMVDYLAGRHIRFGELLDSDLRERLLGVANARYELAFDLPQPLNAPLEWHEQMQVFSDAAQNVDALVDTYQIVSDAVNLVNALPPSDVAVFEGAQGVLLDQYWGLAPYYTWSDTTSRKTFERQPAGPAYTTVLGVTRTYLTRHGRGPMPTEYLGMKVVPDSTNPHNLWQEQMRYGWQDLALLSYAARADANLDGLIVTCGDKLRHDLVSITGNFNREPLGHPDDEWARLLEDTTDSLKSDARYVPRLLAEAANVPLYAISLGPTAEDKYQIAPVSA